MDRTAIFVDAGYLFASGSKLVASERLSRVELQLDHEAMFDLLTRLSAELTGLPLLRIYWYDGASAGPSVQQTALGYRPHVKLRLGFLNQQGQQLGVDSLIIGDLITLARNRAMTDALLMTGDEDVRVGVQQAQELGVRVHLVGIAPLRDNLSSLLAQEADTVRELELAEVASFLSRYTDARPANTYGAMPGATLEDVARQVAKALGQEAAAAVLRDSVGGSLAPAVDRQLLMAGTEASGGAALSAEQKRTMRAAFLQTCRQWPAT